MLFPDNVMMQISFIHILFNVITTAILLPLSNYLVKLACTIIPGEDKNVEAMSLHYLDPRILQTPPIAVAQVLKEVERMGTLAQGNFNPFHGGPVGKGSCKNTGDCGNGRNHQLSESTGYGVFG